MTFCTHILVNEQFLFPVFKNIRFHVIISFCIGFLVTDSICFIRRINFIRIDTFVKFFDKIIDQFFILIKKRSTDLIFFFNVAQYIF